MGVVPEESYARSHEGRTEYRELARAAQEIDVEVLTRIDASNDVGVKCESERSDRGQSGGEPVEAVGDIHRIARPGHHEGHEQHVDPRHSGGEWNDQDVFV